MGQRIARTVGEIKVVSMTPANRQIGHAPTAPMGGAFAPPAVGL